MKIGHEPLKFIFQLSHKLNHICKVVASIFLFIMSALVIIQVIARYIFDAPPQWTEEAARYCMVWMGLLGATVSFYKKQDPVLFQPNVDTIQKWGPLIKVIEYFAVMIFISPLIYFGPSFLMRNYGRHTETLQIDTAFIVAIIPLYAVIVAIHALARLLSKETIPDEYEQHVP